MEVVHAVVRLSGPEPPAEALRSLHSWLALAGGRGIGWHSDEYPVILPPGHEIDVGEATQVEHLSPTARPHDLEPPEVTGVVALRWFEVDPADWEEFLELSTHAWPAFESSYDAHILGLFRSLDAGPEAVRALLATRYASYAEWERSRQALAATRGKPAEAGHRFQRRREITRRSVVRVAPPL